MKTLYVIDAVNYLFRSYYAIAPMTNREGATTSALYGFIRSVQKLLKENEVHHLVCVFDGPNNKKKRQELFAEYKGHRKGAPEDLFPQFALAQEYCHLAGIRTLCIDEVEADDAMATIALWGKKEGLEVFLCTSDKDLAQLVSPHISLLFPHKDYAKIGEKEVVEIFGVPPSQMLDYLSIVGDASDNIPGIPGFGPKTAASLLREFGSLDAILAHPERVPGAKKQEALRENQKIAMLSRQLASLDTDVEVPRDVSWYALQESSLEGLREFFQRMDFVSLLKELSKGEKSSSKTYLLVETKEQLQELFDEIVSSPHIAIDTETTSLDVRAATLVGVSFATAPHRAWYVSCGEKISPLVFRDLFLEFLSRYRGSFMGHNLKYDWHIFANLEIDLSPIFFDTMLASHLLDPQARRHNLDDLALHHFSQKKIPIESLIGKGKTACTMDKVPVEKVKDYACEDVDVVEQLFHLFAPLLEKRGVLSLFSKVEMPLLPVLAKMEREGIYLDKEKLEKIGKEQKEQLDTIAAEIFSDVGEEFNLNSPKQISTILFEKLSLPKPKGKSAFATSADVLRDLEHPLADKILLYRSLEKLRSTYIEALPSSISSQTGRIHCTFNQSGTATGRLSCQDPNLQNIPVRDEMGKAIRSCFMPEKKGWSFLSADYSQIELRLLAHFSEDATLLSAFLAGEDIHAYTASQVFQIPLHDVTPKERHIAKTVNFGILYGQGPFGLSKLLRISMQQAEQFIRAYFARYPQVETFLASCARGAEATGYAVTITGRQRPIPEIDSKNPTLKAAAIRLAVNTPLQGTAADLLKMAMIEIDKKLREKGFEAKMLLQIHDELLFEVPSHEVESLSHLVKKEMEGVWKLKVPLLVDIGVGKNWAEC